MPVGRLVGPVGDSHQGQGSDDELKWRKLVVKQVDNCIGLPSSLLLHLSKPERDLGLRNSPPPVGRGLNNAIRSFSCSCS